MDTQNEILEFLLDTAVRQGDSPTSAKARYLHDKLREEMAPMASILNAIPHEGAQPPQEKTEDGLGGSTDVKPEDVPVQETVNLDATVVAE